MKVFARVVDEGGFAKAARALDVLERDWMAHLNGPLRMGHIGVGCALGRDGILSRALRGTLGLLLGGLDREAVDPGAAPQREQHGLDRAIGAGLGAQTAQIEQIAIVLRPRRGGRDAEQVALGGIGT